VLAQELMKLEVAEHLGAERNERTAERTVYRNGYRERALDTGIGSIEPASTAGTRWQLLPQPAGAKAACRVGTRCGRQGAFLQGIRARRVDDLVQALGMQGISKSQVSRLCSELDKEVERFRTRRLEVRTVCVAECNIVTVREHGRVVSQAIVITIASPPTVSARCSGSTSARVRAAASGWHSGAIWPHARCTG
jgi:putative transposase